MEEKKLSGLNRWLTLLANIAVFASIMFLAVEISQNQTAIEESNRLSRLDARVIEIEQFNEFRQNLIEDPELLQIWNVGMADGELTDSEQDRFFLLCTNIIWISAGSWERSVALGRMDAAEATTRIRAEMIEGSSYFESCWEFMRGNLEPYGLTEYVALVEGHRAETSE